MSFSVERSWATEPLHYEAPHPPSEEPRPYQHAAVEYALARDHCLIGDAPGVGKTAECILISNAIRAKRTLVVCPASLRLNWQREVLRWAQIQNVIPYTIMKAKDGVSPYAHYTIVSYDLLRNRDLLAALMRERWDHCILDEGHYLKDPKGNQRVKPICAPDGLPSVVGRFTLATGTPMPNQPIEVYNAIRLLDWDAIDRASVEDFRDFYYEEGSGFITRRVWDGSKYVFKQQWSDHVRNVPRRLEDIRYRLRSRLMVRRLKTQPGILDQLPPRQWHLFPMSETTETRKAMKHPGWQMVERLYQLDEGALMSDVPIDGEVSTARRLLGEAKAPLVASYIEQLLLEGTEKIVVSAWHHTVLEILRERLEKYGLTYMDGRTGDSKKQEAVDRFQEDDKVRVILGQMLPLGKGWTLTAAQDAVLAEPYWTPGENDQFLDRIHRYGQEADRVLGHVPVILGTLDERVLARAIEKDQNIHQALDGG